MRKTRTPLFSMARRLAGGLVLSCTCALMAACGGGGADPAPTPPAQAAPGTGVATAGPAGVVVTAVDGARVHIPPGATRSEYTVTLARDSEGAPALPPRAAPAGAIYKLTPHGAQFARPVQLSLPFDPDAAPPGSRVVVFKADPGGGWTMLDKVKVKDRSVVVFTDSFSYYMPMFVSAQVWFPTPEVSTQAFVAWSLGSLPTTSLPTAMARDINGNVMVDYFGDPWPQDQLTIVSQPDAAQPLRLTLRAALPANSTAAQECAGAGWEYIVRARHVRYGPTEVDQGGTIYAPELARLRPPQDGTVATVSVDVNLSEYSYEMDPWGGDSHDSWLTGMRILNNPDWPPGLRLEVMGGCVGEGWPSRVDTGGVNLAVRRGFAEGALALVQHPADQTVVEGQSTTLMARANLDSQGRAAGVLTWQRNFAFQPDAWVDLPSFNGNTDWQTYYDPPGFANPGPATYFSDGVAWLNKPAPTQAPDDQGQFRAKLCPNPGTAGACVYSRPARLTVTRNFVAPQVVQQPAASVTVRENVDNEVAQFTATFNGLPTPRVNWQVRQPGAQDFQPVDPATHSVNGATLTVRQRFTLADRGRLYQAVAVNGGGVAISNTSSLWVTTGLAAPSITTQPADTTAATGATALLAGAADGGLPLNYQWLFNGQPITGANGPLLVLNNLNAANAGSYQLEVRNAENTVRSRAARLSVTGAAAPAVQPPSLTVAPAPQTVTAGSTATFAVVAGGSGPLAYQWLRNGADIAGATGPVLSLPQASAATAGDYSVRVSNSAGSVTSLAVALAVQVAPEPPVLVPPTITVQPFGLAMVEGQGATLAVAANGSGPLSYQWLHDGQPVPGATQAALVFPAIDTFYAGRYTVTVSNAAGSVSSDVATLVVTPQPGLPLIGEPLANLSVTAGQTATFLANVQGSPTPQCQWTRNGIAILGATNCARYTTPVLSLADHGTVYNLVAYSPAGVVFGSGGLLSVGSPLTAPTITQDLADVSAPEGGTATFSVTATANGSMNHYWVLSGAPTADLGGSSFTVGPLQASDTGRFVRVIVCNGLLADGLCTTSRDAILTVTPAVPAGALTATQVVAGYEWGMVLRPDRTVWAWGSLHKTDGSVVVSNLAPADQARRPVQMYPGVLADVRQVAGWYDGFWALTGEPGSTGSRVLHWGHARSGSDGRGADGQGNLGAVPQFRANAAPVPMLERRTVNGTLQAAPVDRVCSVAATADRALLIRALDDAGNTTSCAAGVAKTVWVAGTLTQYSGDAVGVVVPVAGLPAVGTSGYSPPARVHAQQPSTWASSGPALVLLEDGRAFGWGDNFGNRFGMAAPINQGTLGSAAAPYALRTVWGAASDVAFGYNSLFVLRADGTLATSGRNEHLELGLGDQPFGTQVDGPTNVLASAGAPFAGVSQMVSTDVQVSLALQDGLIMVWGAGNQALKGAETLATGYPQWLPGSGSGWRALSASHDHALAIAANRAVYSWGRGLRGALGNGVDGGSLLSPNLVTVP